MAITFLIKAINYKGNFFLTTQSFPHTKFELSE